MTKPEHHSEITRLLLDWSGGDQAALSALFPLVYEELRAMAQRHLQREQAAHTLQRTALVHEAFLRLIDQRNVDWHSRSHFFGLASQMMRRILVDYARTRGAAKRGKHAVRIDLDEVLGGDSTDVHQAAQDLVDFGAIDQALAPPARRAR